MDRKIKIMVGSTVYGFENELYQIVALLQTQATYLRLWLTGYVHWLLLIFILLIIMELIYCL